MVGGSELYRIDVERVVGGSELDRLGDVKVIGGRVQDVVDGSVENMEIISIPADMKQKVDHNIYHLFSSSLFCGVFFGFCVFFFQVLVSLWW